MAVLIAVKLWHSALAFVLLSTSALASSGASFSGIDGTCSLRAGALEQEVGFLSCRLDHSGAVGVPSCEGSLCLVHVELQAQAWWYPVGSADARATLSGEGFEPVSICESSAPPPTTAITCYGFTDDVAIPVAAGACTVGLIGTSVRIDEASPTMGGETLVNTGLALRLDERFELCRDASGAPTVEMLT